MHSFVYGLLGGALIGLSAAILLLCSGDILGASGIISSVCLSPLSAIQDATQHWKFALLAGFFLVSNLYLSDVYQDLDNGLASLSWAAFLIGGFLVGFGTRMGNGCTSGHGICGLARFSKRSLASVCTFMVVGIVTEVLTQQATSPFVTGDGSYAFSFLHVQDPQDHPVVRWKIAGALVAGLWALLALIAPTFHRSASYDHTNEHNAKAKLAPATVAGILFGLGLYVSQMVYPVRVFGFLNVALIPQGSWDATLMFVMGGGCIVSMISYQFVDGYNFVVSKIAPNKLAPLAKPLALLEGSCFSVPSNTDIDRDLLVGAVIFGLGWGISGLCPGPAMFLAAIGVSWVLVCYWPAFFLGAFLANHLKGRSWLCCCKTPSSPPGDNDDEMQEQPAVGKPESHCSDGETRGESMTNSHPDLHGLSEA